MASKPSKKPELPPTIVGVVHDSRHNRNRVRVELSPSRGAWLLSLVTKAMADMDIDDPEFRDTYLLRKSLTDQLERLKEN